MSSKKIVKLNKLENRKNCWFLIHYFSNCSQTMEYLCTNLLIFWRNIKQKMCCSYKKLENHLKACTIYFCSILLSFFFFIFKRFPKPRFLIKHIFCFWKLNLEIQYHRKLLLTVYGVTAYFSVSKIHCRNIVKNPKIYNYVSSLFIFFTNLGGN